MISDLDPWSPFFSDTPREFPSCFSRPMSAVRRRGRESTPAGELPSPNGVDDPQAKGPHRDRPPFPPRTLDDAAALFLRYEEWLTPLLLTLASFVLHFRNIAIWDKVWCVCCADLKGPADAPQLGRGAFRQVRRQLHPSAVFLRPAPAARQNDDRVQRLGRRLRRFVELGVGGDLPGKYPLGRHEVVLCRIRGSYSTSGLLHGKGNGHDKGRNHCRDNHDHDRWAGQLLQGEFQLKLIKKTAFYRTRIPYALAVHPP